MQNTLRNALYLMVVSLAAGAGSVLAQPMYQVTITNTTKAQTFTPVLVASHTAQASITSAGATASAGLETLAEDGATATLQSELEASDQVREVATSTGLLGPGESVTVEVTARRAPRISLAAMLVPTNDTFVFVNSIEGPRRRNQTVRARAFAYDSGTEVNDELCDNVAGPADECSGGAGSNGAPTAGAEGFVHIANGIQGVGDLSQSTRDWRGNVANITIRRVRSR